MRPISQTRPIDGARPAEAIGTLPPVGALGRFAGRVRRNPWLAVAIVAGALLVAAWLAWAIYVGSDKGFNEAVGVLIAWPALVVAAALIFVPLIAIYLLVRPREAESPQGSGPSQDGGSGEPDEAQATETG
jgi:hypothetical protein